jgi:hypothetical protein
MAGEEEPRYAECDRLPREDEKGSGRPALISGGRRSRLPLGARPEQVVKITIYVVHHRPEYLPAIPDHLGKEQQHANSQT